MKKSIMKPRKLTGSELTTERFEVLDRYDAVLLGAPFKVILVKSVRRYYDIDSDKVIRTWIPNLTGLRKAVALARCMNPRKLSGLEIKFVRKAIDYKAIELANLLDIGPEHLSRCESGERLLSGAAEKLLRVIVLKRAHMLVDVIEDLIASIEQSGKHYNRIDELKIAFGNYRDCVADLEALVLNMSIQPAYDTNDPLTFSFQIRELSASDGEDKNEEDIKWKLAA